MWCDSVSSQKFQELTFKFEEKPGSKTLVEGKNPVKIETIHQILNKLLTSDLHSISLTGGEPLCQLDFILNLVEALSNLKIPLYLETNGTLIPEDNKLERLAKNVRFCCCDIKDRSSKAASDKKWLELVEIELNFIRKMITHGIATFAKIVVTSQTSLQDIEWICKNLSEIKYPDGEMVGLAIQPATLDNEKQKNELSISNEHLNRIFSIAGKYISPESISLSIQAQKYLNLK